MRVSRTVLGERGGEIPRATRPINSLYLQAFLMVETRRLPFGCRAASKPIAARLSSRSPRRSTASRCASAMRCAYVESVIASDVMPISKRTPIATR